MKVLSTMLAAAFVAGSCSLAMAQASGGTGGSGAGGANQTQQVQPSTNADKNPSGPAANPAAGNTAVPNARSGGSAAMPAPSGGMRTAPSSNTRSDSPAKPAAGNDATGAKTGQGGSK